MEPNHIMSYNVYGWTPCTTTRAWWAFCHVPFDPCRFLASDWSGIFRALAEQVLIRLSSNLIEKFYTALPRTELQFSHASMNSVCPALWLLEQFPCICIQTADPFALKFGCVGVEFNMELPWPGIRPTKDISIEFKIQWNSIMLLIVTYSADRTSRQ